MPYRWTDDSHRELHLWPRKSLRPEGFVFLISITGLLFLLPLFAVLGTAVLLGLLPFILAVLAGLWWAIRRNNRDRDIVEILSLTPKCLRLIHRDGAGQDRTWEANPYWVRVNCEIRCGPAENYLTLEGGPRPVEIGAFLSDEERLSLKDDLERALDAR